MTFRIVLTCLFSFNIGLSLAKAAAGKDTAAALIGMLADATLVYGVWNWL